MLKMDFIIVPVWKRIEKEEGRGRNMGRRGKCSVSQAGSVDSPRQPEAPSETDGSGQATFFQAHDWTPVVAVSRCLWQRGTLSCG